MVSASKSGIAIDGSLEPHDLEVTRDRDRITLRGPLTLNTYPRLLAALHNAGLDGQKSLILDFSGVARVQPGAVVATCAQVLARRESGVEVEIVEPAEAKTRKLFLNSNWAHLLSPTRFGDSTFSGYRHVPATVFTSPSEQQKAVNAILGVLLTALNGIDRSDLAAIEWALNEITDNVLMHAQSESGGIVQVTTFEKMRRHVEFIVCDGGVSIPATLRAAHKEITSDVQALERAIREGITRDKSVGQGNGLFGTFEVCRISKGSFTIHSRRASLSYDERRGLRISSQLIPYGGTLVVASIDCSRSNILGEALKFGGVKHQPIDMIETKYEIGDGELCFKLAEEATSFGSRPAGATVRAKLTNLVRMCPGRRIKVDLSDVPLVSSSFADEVFGKLFLDLGPIEFMRTFDLRNLSDTVGSLIDKAITDRNYRK